VNGEAIMAVSTAVVALTQLMKWWGVISHRKGVVGVIVFSTACVALWAWAHIDTVSRQTAWDYFMGWIAVVTSAAGVYGFTRATSESVSSMRSGADTR
jgi:hypothetical protein